MPATPFSILIIPRFCRVSRADIQWNTLAKQRRFPFLRTGMVLCYGRRPGMTDREYMLEALALAREGAAAGEVPVGCVIVRGDEIVGRGRNRREEGRSALAHAELEAISQACTALGGWRLWECTLYVTLEPCPMCAGAIVNARIPRVVYGAKDAKAGSCGSVCDLFSMAYNHHPQVEAGALEEECAKLLTDFFRELRVELRTRPKWRKRMDN